MKNLGKIQLGNTLTGEVEKEIAITEFIRSVYKDHRLCTVIKTEENTFVLAVENPESTGRGKAQMHLTEESMLALANCIFLYYIHKGEDIIQRMKELIPEDSTEADMIHFEYANKDSQE